MPKIKSKVVRVRNPVTREWNELPAVVSEESFAAAERAHADAETAQAAAEYNSRLPVVEAMEAARAAEASARDAALALQVVENQFPEGIAQAAKDWLDDNVVPVGSAVVVDSSLLIEGAAADAKKTGEEVTDIKHARYYNLGAGKNHFSTLNMVSGLVNSTGGINPPPTASPNVVTTDFIPVEPNTQYYFNTPEAYYRPQIIGYYKADKEFIDRITVTHDDTQYFTTPANCQYIRVTEHFNHPFPDQLMLSDSGFVPYEPHNVLMNTSTQYDKQSVDYMLGSGKFDDVIDKLSAPGSINTSNIWADLSDSSHSLIPVKTGDEILLIAGSYSAVYTFLKDEICRIDEDPSFAYQYDIDYNTFGELTFTVLKDGDDNPLKDTRHTISGNSYKRIIAPPEAKYLYLTRTTTVNGAQRNLIPTIIINGNQYNNQIVKQKKYDTVLFDDFDNFNTDIWERIIADPPTGGSYNSRFFTTEDNAYTENSCLVLKCAKGDSGNNGTYIDADGDEQNIEYLAPYISSGKRLAITGGRISAKIKTSKELSKYMLPWCFWTFGQNAPWSYAHEVDIIEGVQVITGESSSRPLGSVLTYLYCDVHSADENGDDVDTTRYIQSVVAEKNDGVIGDDTVVTNNYPDYDCSEWHVYTVEWDSDNIAIYIDNILIKKFNAVAVDAHDYQGNIGFNYPQDIRMNIKASVGTTADEGYLFVDWVKVESENKTPCTSIAHEDISLTVGQTAYINPVFNDYCTNKAFEMETNDTSIIKIENQRNNSSKLNIHSIKAIGAGTATVTLKSQNNITTNTFTVTVSS